MELSIDNKRDIDQALKESLEAIEDLAMDNHDIRPSFAVWSPWRRQASINHIRNHQIALNTQVPAVGEHTGGGEAGVLDLQTMQWTRIEIYDETGVEDEMHSGVETAQESANANETGSPQGATIQASGTPSTTQEGQRDGEEGEVGLNEAAPERVAQHDMEESARGGQ